MAHICSWQSPGLQVRYESRRRLAETRPRVRGQFVKGASAAESPSGDFTELVRLIVLLRCLVFFAIAAWQHRNLRILLFSFQS